jgi:WD40 repeat protein
MMLASGSMLGTVSLWNVETGRLSYTLEVGPMFGGVAFSPNGSTLATGWLCMIDLYHTATGVRFLTLDLRKHNDPFVDVPFASSMAFSLDGKMLAVGIEDGEIILWDIANHRWLMIEGNHGSVVNVAFWTDEKTLTSGYGDGTIILWDAKSGGQLRTLTGNIAYMNSVDFPPDGTIVASGTGNVIILWDTVTGEWVRTLEGHTSYVNSVAFSPDGKTLASGSDDGTVILWDVTP